MDINTVLEYINKLDVKTLIGMSIFCILVDIVTGYIKAFKNRKLNSSVSRDGYIKKLTWPISILIGLAFRYFVGISLVLYMSVAVCCLTEIVSILENLCELNPDLNIFKKYLEKAQK